jgi:hypothetical protein
MVFDRDAAGMKVKKGVVHDRRARDGQAFHIADVYMMVQQQAAQLLPQQGLEKGSDRR